MKTMMKFATAATLAGALAVAVATPSQARISRGGAAAIGFGAGALVGAAAANAANNGYYYGPRYRAAPHAYGYYVEPGYGAYAYAPRGYRNSSEPMCAVQGSYGKEDDRSFC